MNKRDAFNLGIRVAVFEKLSETNNSFPWLPLAAGAGLGLGVYGLARTPFLANVKKWPVLRKIQDLASGKMYRADLRNAPQEIPKGLKKLKRSVLHGPEAFEEGLPSAAIGTSKKPTAVWSGQQEALPGTFDPSIGPYAGETSMSEFMGHFIDNLSDKMEQARLLAKSAPGTMARSLSLRDLLKKHKVQLRRGKSLPRDLRNLQKVLEKEFGGKEYMIKSRLGREGGDIAAASSGVFPTGETDLAKSYQQWLKMRPEYRKAVEAVEESVTNTDINKVIEQFRTKPGFEGRIVDELLHKNVLFQEKLPLQHFSPRAATKMKARGLSPTKEYRIHSVGGKAIPSLAQPRFYPGMLRTLPEVIRARRAAKWVQKNVLDKLEGSAREISYGMDVAPLQGGGYKIIEMNPGGASGLLETPIIGTPLLHKAVTGRYPRGLAALLGSGAGVAGIGTANAAT